MNIANKEEVMQECLERMSLLKLDKMCISAFRNGKIWESERIGALYELNEEERQIIEKFEKENIGYKVYHVIHNTTEFGELYNLLYVSTYKEEWEQDRADLRENYVLCYVYNKDADFCSEFGTIAIKPNIGGLVRVA